MRRTLLVAEGSLHRPVLNILSIAIGFSVTLLLGLLILRMPLSLWMTITAIALVVIAIAWIKGRYGGPREFRVERPVAGGALRLTGRFENGEIPVSKPRDVTHTEHDADTLTFHVNGSQGPESYHLRPPAFSHESMTTLRGLIDELPTLPESALLDRYAKGRDGIKAYDAKQLLLLRFTQKPGFMLITWAVSGLTLLFWLFVLSAVLG